MKCYKSRSNKKEPNNQVESVLFALVSFFEQNMEVDLYAHHESPVMYIICIFDSCSKLFC